MLFQEKNSAWVSIDGTYGTGYIITFDSDALTDEQWEVLSELRDNDKYDYVFAVLNNDNLDEWEK